MAEIPLNIQNSGSLPVPPDDFVIVIGRQFGSGGRRIGKLVAEMLGCCYYDSEILSKAAEKLGFSSNLFEIHDEKKPSILRTVLQGSFGIPDNFHPVSIGAEGIYDQQRRVIKEICKNRKCVIVGRTADYILRNNPFMFSVFLHSPIEARANAVIRRGEASSLNEAVGMARKKDREREAYYNFFTGHRKWGIAENYHLSVETSGLSENDIAELIVITALKYFKNQERKK